MKKTSITIFSFLLLLVTFSSQAQVQLLAGIERGTYFQLANEMNDLFPATQKIVDQDTIEIPFFDIRSTAGSSINLDLLADKNHPAKAAIMQFDVLLTNKVDDVLNGTHITDDLVVLMPLNIEVIHLVTKKETGIHSLSDLAGHTIGIGTKKEGTYFTALHMQSKSDIDWRNRNIDTESAIKALLTDKIEGFFVVASAPMDMLRLLPTRAGDDFLLPSLENINGWADYYIPVVIPADTYPWQKEAVSTYAVPSVIVVNVAKLSDKDKQDLINLRETTKANLEQLKTNGHVAWKTALTEWDFKDWPLLQ